MIISSDQPTTTSSSSSSSISSTTQDRLLGPFQQDAGLRLFMQHVAFIHNHSKKRGKQEEQKYHY